ncbi:hypothetical protein EXIGLDRAFT_53024 [Exidia glandulosa HHB12029]|uniref:Extracellular membrane protein CFEM domain-containing protein n=1 Tax=Exidia glandulosa HHB12029 TaxID=1314781 RepID=A0A165IDL0_EXIGL|nr:hypothetical protein EXIGLDRAFT_53024 [Exidia glandulosa HHB12029]
MCAGTLLPALVVVLAGQALAAAFDSQFTLPFTKMSPACLQDKCDLVQSSLNCGSRAGCLCTMPFSTVLKTCLECLVDGPPTPDAVQPVQNLVDAYRVACADAGFNVERIAL